MDRFTRLGFVLLGIVALSACGDDSVKLDTSPAVSVSADKSSGTGPLAVQFFSSVVNGNGVLTYDWNFGDGEASDLANPNHIFDAGAEAYNVILTVTDEDDDQGVAVLQVAVGTDDEPTVMVSATPTTGTVPLTVEFDCTAAGGDGELDVLWSFGEGSTDSFANTSFTYTQNGVYVASCTVEDADGDRARATVTIAVGSDIVPGIPQAIGNATPITGTAPLEVDFFGSSIGGDGEVSLAWDFGDGESDTVGTVSHTYTAAGIYNALLTATDADGDSDTALVTITVVDPAVGVNVAPVAEASIVSGACAMTGRTTVQLDGAASSDANGDALFMSWQFVTVPSGSQTTFNNSTVTNPVFTPDRDGDYVIRLVVNDGQAFDASSTLTITADGPSVVVATAGNNQTGVVNTDAPTPVAVNVSNACGATAAGIDVRWSGFNMLAGFSQTTTTAAGDTGTGLRFGTSSGAGTLTATVVNGGANVSLDYTMTPGPASALIMDDASTVEVSDTASTLTYRVTDSFGNPVTSPDVTFDLALDVQSTTSSALFNNCTTGTKTLAGITTVAGVATVNVCNTVAEDAFVAVTQIGTLGIQPAGRVTLFQDDMESDDAGWQNLAEDGNDWQRGAPTFPGGLTVPSPTNVRGTRLNGQIFDIGVTEFTSLARSFDLSYPVGSIFGIELGFEHYVDIQGGCAQATLFRDEEFGSIVRPLGGYPAGCGVEGFDGTFDDFQPVRFDLSGFAGDTDFDLLWSVGYFNTFDSVSGAGWYIDDVVISAIVQVPRVRFVAGAPTEVVVTADRAGKVDGCASAVVRGVVTDAFGNVVSRDGDALTLTSSNNDVTFTAASLGRNFSGASTTTSTVTTVGGQVLLLLDTGLTSGPVNANVSGIVTGLAAGASATAAVALEDPSAELCADDIDNDCDGLLDCADLSDCDASPACSGDSCADPFELGTDEFAATFSTCFHEDPQGSGQGQPSEDFSFCTGGDINGEDMISSFTLSANVERYEVCIDASDIAGNSDIVVSESCNTGTFNFGDCFNSAGSGRQCQTLFGPSAGTYFLFWKGEDPGQCGDLIVDTNIVEDNCFDNLDNDGNGDTDCEDQDCRDDFNCETFASDDFCDFIDNGNQLEVANGGFVPNGTIDEFACRCFGDAGCDGMPPWPGTTGPLLCNPGNGVCVPNCNEFDFCFDAGQTCNPGTGLCEAGGA